MGKRLAELNRKIRRKLDELADDRQEREQATRIVHRRNVAVAEAKAELAKARRRLGRRRDAVEEIREELEALEAETPDEDTAEEQKLREQLDDLAGQLEEAVAVRDRWLDRLDRRQDQLAEARDALREAVEESRDDRDALERMRRRRRRIQEAIERRDQPSPNFHWAEFDCNDGTPIPEKSKPAIKAWCLTVGEPMRARYGSVHINSGHRHRDYNRRIGGEENSVHIYDFPGRLPPQDDGAAAVDSTCERGTPRDWHNFAAGKADGRGVYRTFVHNDNRNRIGWPDAVWSG